MGFSLHEVIFGNTKEESIKARNERKEIRADKNVLQSKYKYDSHKVAYTHGLDPNSDMWGAISSGVGSIAGIFGGSGQGGGPFNSGTTGGGLNVGGMWELFRRYWIILLGAAVLILSKKPKSR